MGEGIVLKKSLTVLDCISYLISMIIGSGIFIVPNGIIRDSGSVGVALLIWILGGVFYAVFGALTYAELGCLIPKTGGEYIYLKSAFGDASGFLFIWSYALIYFPSVAAFASLLFSDYALKVFFPTCPSPDEARLILAAVAIIIITMINCMDVKLGQNFGYLFNFGKILGLLLIIGIGAYGLFLGRFESFKYPFADTSSDFTRLAIAFNAGCFSYGGWNSLNNLVGEMKNPNRTFPLSIFGGLFMVIIIYLLVNIAYLTFLSPKEMIMSNAVAFNFVEKLIGPYSWIISIFVCLSGLGFINGTIVGSSRIIFAAAKNSHMPSVFSLINLKYKSPMTAVIISGVIATLYTNLKDMDTLLNIAMLLAYLVNISCVLVLFHLRRARPYDERPFKVPLFFAVIFLVVCTILTAMICYIYSRESFMCLIFIASGIPVYYIFTKVEKPEGLQTKIDNFSIFMQKLTLSVPGDKEE